MLAIEMRAWEPGEQYCLREVGSAVIYCTDAPGPFPIHGRFLDIQGQTPSAWGRNGRWSGGNPEKASHPLDLTILHKV
jgi:hypothetical protein